MSTIEYYNTNATEYAASTVHANVSALYDHFLPYLAPDASILDLGCGSGRDSKFFIDAGYHVTAVDGSQELCLLASEYINQPVRHLLFADLDYHEQFDAVWACASLLHVPKMEIHGIFQKISIALKNHGILYLSFKYGNSERDSGERLFSDYTESDIPWLVENTDFSVIEFWQSLDVRSNRTTEKWLNIIFRKVESFDPTAIV